MGLSTFQSVEGSNIPLRKTYSKVRVYGNSIIDKLQIKNIEISDSELQNIIMTDNLIWDANTLLMAEFENDLVAGNIADLTNPITKWQINRREVSGSTFKVLDVVDVGVSEYIDYSAQHGKNYIYSLFATSENEQSEPLECEEIETDFFGWYLIGNDPDGSTYVYVLDLNVSSGSITNDEDFTEYQGYGKFNSFAKGQRNFIRGSVQAIAGTIQSNSTLLQSVDYIDTLRNRIQDVSTKILKNRKGEIWKVKTHGYNASQLDDSINQQVYLVNFNFIQCEEM